MTINFTNAIYEIRMLKVESDNKINGKKCIDFKIALPNDQKLLCHSYQHLHFEIQILLEQGYENHYAFERNFSLLIGAILLSESLLGILPNELISRVCVGMI